jgi:uncharacterized protein YneR
MRRIVTKTNQEKKDKRNQLVLGVLLIGLMLFSVLGYALSGRNPEEDSKKIDYSGIEFIQDNSGYWNFKVNDDSFITKYNPEEIQDISFSSNLDLVNYFNKPLYIIGNFQEPIFEISRNLNPFVLRFQEACLSKNDCENDLPIKNCSVDNIVIIDEIEIDNESIEEIYQQDNCVFITASLGNQTKYADKFLFEIIGI